LNQIDGQGDGIFAMSARGLRGIHMETTRIMKTKQFFTSGTVATVALALALSAPRVQGQNMIIYANSLVNGWEN
jgi:hypothetical protein